MTSNLRFCRGCFQRLLKTRIMPWQAPALPHLVARRYNPEYLNIKVSEINPTTAVQS